jgi:hypothetical protein
MQAYGGAPQLRLGGRHGSCGQGGAVGAAKSMPASPPASIFDSDQRSHVAGQYGREREGADLGHDLRCRDGADETSAAGRS